MGATKHIVRWGLGLLLVSGAAIAVFLATAGDDFYRWATTKLVEGAVDREIHFDGAFSFQIGLQPTLRVTDVWVENAPWTQKKEMGRIEHAEVQIDLKSLVRGIVVLPRIVLQGLTLDLERGADGKSNFDLSKTRDVAEDTPLRKDWSLPVFGLISAKDAAITYADRETGRKTEILLESLRKEPVASRDQSLTIQGKGSINRQAFQLEGRFGSIEDALAATVPYPLELTLKTSGLEAKLSGTVRDLAEAEGFDLSLTAQAPSIVQLTKAWNTQLPLGGSATGSARLKGNLESLSLEEVVLEVVEPSTQELRVEGSVTDVVNKKGLDLQFTGNLDAEALGTQQWLLDDLPRNLRDVLHGTTRLEIGGRIRGDAETPSLEKLRMHLKHGTKAELSLDGHVKLDMSKGHPTFTGLGATGTLSLPDPALLAQALGTRLPDVGPIRASTELSLADGWIMLRSFKAQATSFAALRLNAAGRIGRFSDDKFSLALEPRLNLSASAERSRPLIALLVPDANGAGNDLVLLIQKRLKSAGLHPGPTDGKMGPHTRSAIEAYQAQHGLPVDGRATPALLHHLQQAYLENRDDTPGSDTDRIRSIQEALQSAGLHPGTADGKMGPHTRAAIEAYQTQHGLPVDGRATPALLHDLQQASPENRDHTPGSDTDRIRSIQEALQSAGLHPGTADGKMGPHTRAAIEAYQTRQSLPVDGQATQALLEHLQQKPEILQHQAAGQAEDRYPQTPGSGEGEALPELGAVDASGRLSGRDASYQLDDLKISFGESTESPNKPAARVIGNIGDLLSMKQFELNVDVNLPSTKLLAASLPDLGAVTGKGVLTDRKGRLTLDDLSLRVAKEGYLALKASGAVADVLEGDQLDVTLSLDSPDPRKLAGLFGADIGQLPPLASTGRLTGVPEQATFKGSFTLGQTEFRVDLAGDGSGDRPSIKGTIDASVLHLADIGVAPSPEPVDASRQEKAAKHQNRDPLFSKAPFDISGLHQADLSLVVRLDQIEGINLSIDNADVTVNLQDGRLRIHPARLVFSGGSLLADFGLDTTDAQSIFLKVTGDDVQVGPVLAQVKRQVPIEGGLLNLFIDLDSHGDSSHDLVSNLNGRVGFAVENAQILRRLVDALAVDLFRWTLHSVIDREHYVPVDCMVLRTTSRSGTITIDELFTKGQYLRMRGKGTVGLDSETLDMTLLPKKKGHFFDAVTPINIRGDLRSPTISAVPYKEVALIAGMAMVGGTSILSPEIYVPALALGYLWDHLKNKKRKSPCLAEDSMGNKKQ